MHRSFHWRTILKNVCSEVWPACVTLRSDNGIKWWTCRGTPPPYSPGLPWPAHRFCQLLAEFPIEFHLKMLFTGCFVTILALAINKGFDRCDRPSNFTQIGFKISIFWPVWHWNLMDDGRLFYAMSSVVYRFKAIGESNWSYNPEIPNSGQNRRFFLSHVTSKLDRWPWKTIGHLVCVM